MTGGRGHFAGVAVRIACQHVSVGTVGHRLALGYCDSRSTSRRSPTISESGLQYRSSSRLLHPMGPSGNIEPDSSTITGLMWISEQIAIPALRDPRRPK